MRRRCSTRSATCRPASSTGENGGHELWSLVLEASRLDEVVEQVIRTLEFSVLAKYAFALAQAFNAFYNLTRAARRSSTKSATTCGGGARRPSSTCAIS